MKRGKKILAFLLIITMLLPFVMNIPAEAAEKSKQLDVLFTHDTHSHLNSFSTIVDGEQKEVGGFAKLKTLIDEKKKENPDTLLLDGGDFSMGTLIQTVYDTEAAELRMLGYLGCDVSTLGNHEYDYRSKGLADMLTAAKNSGETVPSLVVCNVDWASMEKNGVFTVGDLKYLSRTGRIKGSVATIGNVLKIKPILRGNKDGYIVSYKNCRGRKSALNELVNLVCDNIVEPEKQILGIAHADAYEDSLYIMNKIQQKIKVRDFINTSYDFCTGSHVGPDTIALFFIGKDRELS
jgi:hypothetical protein